MPLLDEDEIIDQICYSPEDVLRRKLIQEINDPRIAVAVSTRVVGPNEKFLVEFYEVSGEWTRPLCDIMVSKKSKIPLSAIASFIRSLVAGGFSGASIGSSTGSCDTSASETSGTSTTEETDALSDSGFSGAEEDYSAQLDMFGGR